MWNRIISLGLFGLASLFIYRADSTNTSVITTQKGHVYVPLLNHGVDVRGADFITCYVKACSDVHVGMASEESNFQSKMYVVLIGSWSNTVSSIKELNEAGTMTKLSGKHDYYLNCDSYRKFNISWSGGKITVFAVDSLIMQSGMGMGMFPINYLGISTWNNYMGHWIFEIPESLVTTSSWLSTSDDLQISYYSVTSPDSYLETSTIQMTSSDETVHSFSDSFLTSSEDLHTSVEPISSLDTTISLEGQQVSFDSASSALQMAMTSSEGQHTSFESISSHDTTISLEGQQVHTFSDSFLTSSEDLHTSVEPISSLDTTMSSEGLQASFDSALSALQMAMTSSEGQHTSFESISSHDTTMSLEGQQVSFDSASSALQMAMTSSVGPQTSFNPASSVYQMTSSETLQTTFDTIPSNDSTTSSEGTKTMQTEYNCKCFYKILFKPKQSVNEHITEIQNRLLVSRHNLSATVRRYISVSDNRPSAVSLGVAGVACLVCCVLVIILPDFLSLILCLKNYFGF